MKQRVGGARRGVTSGHVGTVKAEGRGTGKQGGLAQGFSNSTTTLYVEGRGSDREQAKSSN